MASCGLPSTEAISGFYWHQPAGGGEGAANTQSLIHRGELELPTPATGTTSWELLTPATTGDDAHLWELLTPAIRASWELWAPILIHREELHCTDSKLTPVLSVNT